MIKTNLFLVLDANIETLNTKVSIFDAETRMGQQIQKEFVGPSFYNINQS